MSIKPIQYTMAQLIEALDDFDQLQEIQMHFRRGTKYITNIDVRQTLAPETRDKLRKIELMIEDLLTDDKGYPNVTNWDKLRYHNGSAHFWLRFKDINPKEAILTLKSISIAFPCHKE